MLELRRHSRGNAGTVLWEDMDETDGPAEEATLAMVPASKANDAAVVAARAALDLAEQAKTVHEATDLISPGLQHLTNNRSWIDSRDGLLIRTHVSHGQDPFHSLHKIPTILFDQR